MLILYTLPFGLNLTEVIILGLLFLMLVIGIIFFSYNYRRQMKVSLMFDHESDVYSKYGFELFLNKKGNKFTKPTLLVVYIRNLDYLYAHYPLKHQLMVQIANCILAGLDKKEIIGRFEFDKFVVIRDNLDDSAMKEYINKINERLLTAEFENYGNYSFDLVFGLNPSPKLDEISLTDEITIRIPEYSQTFEKNIYYLDSNVNRAIERNNAIDKAKNEALETKAIAPYYQGIYSLEDGKIKGVEVLSRWNLYQTDEFIKQFKSSGFIKELDKRMLERASQEFNSVRASAPGVTLHFNISKQFFESHEFEETVQGKVLTAGLTLNDVVFEINPKNETINMNKLRNLALAGYKFALDCLGNSSLQLSDIDPQVFKYVKIDRTIVQRANSNFASGVMLTNLIRILSVFEIPVVCVGIETQEMMDRCAQGSNKVYVQGFFMHQPSPISGVSSAFTYTCKCDYPEVSLDSPALVTTDQGSNNATNITINNANSKSEIDRMRQEMLEMQMRQQEQMQQFYEKVRLNNHNSNNNNNNDEINRLRQEIENMKNEQRESLHRAEIQRMQDEIDNLKKGKTVEVEQVKTVDNSNVDINQLINRLQEMQDDKISDVLEQSKRDKSSLEKELEKEKKQREDLETLVAKMKEENANLVDKEDKPKVKVVKKILRLKKKGSNTEEATEVMEEVPTEDEGPKPVLTMDEVLAIINYYQSKSNEWAKKAQEELKGGFEQVLSDAKYYQDSKPKSFYEKMKIYKQKASTKK